MASDDYTEEALFSRGVLQLALELRMSVNGMSDPLEPEHERALVEYLNKRLRDWKPTGLEKWRAFDSAVVDVIMTALVEHVEARRLRDR